MNEIALTRRLFFNEKKKLVEGFVDYGKHTPNILKNQRADHALEFLFQPFRGQWLQVSLNVAYLLGMIFYRYLIFRLLEAF